ncbi:T9SS type A sorting domain-containing protein [Chryseobacterium foetidum]|uniref:T9SS type A sorting domain-containing protein n=1 Tax=Chryseobacterium foetidum TaxID=2951057 RepID=UPI0021C8B884|nr:T9SS type A sorting domain-containing protein [Chryseobacterium foetidum]
MKFKISTFLFILFFLTAKSQAPNIQWQKAFGGSLNDAAYSVAQTPDGGYIIAGTTNSTQGNITVSHGNDDFWVVKTDGSGNLQWQKSFGGTGSEQARSVITTADGGYIVAGFTSSNNGHITYNRGSNDYWVIKLDSTGNLQWQKTYGGGGNDMANSICQTSDGGYIIAGASNSVSGDITNPKGDNDYWIVKTDALGNLLWQKSLGGDNNDKATEIKQTKDGGYIVAGDSSSSIGDYSTPTFGFSDFWIVKISSTGNIIWEKRYGGSQNDFAHSVKPTSDDGFIVAGNTFSVNGHISGSIGPSDAWLIKLDQSGNLQWEKSLGGQTYDAAKSVIQTSDGGYLIAGDSAATNGIPSGNNGTIDFYVVKLNSTGNVMWHKCLGGDNTDFGMQIIQTSDGGAVIVGEAHTFNNGQVTGSFGGKDFWMVKLTTVLSTAEVSDKSKISVYPNPVKDFLHLENLPKKSLITISDISGRKTMSEKSADSKTVIDVSDYSSGIYMLQIENGGKPLFSEKIFITK